MTKRSDPTMNVMGSLPGAEQSRPRAAVPVETIDPAHRAGVERALERARRREFATDAEIEAAYQRFRPA